MDKLNRDGNMLGRLLALGLLFVAVVGVSRVCSDDGTCPFMSGVHCPYER